MANDSSQMWWVDGPLNYDKLATDAEARLVAAGCICDRRLTVTHHIDDRKEPPVVYQQAYHGNPRCPLRP